ncbi:MAG: hypothetical protein G01um101438_116 [Parcubacteria group bacterium Gr01-1014_38]|nr:MAG: hypothetical protein G01um101438_116 [Parcubacteria group bacterium Gr01-1014_38]
MFSLVSPLTGAGAVGLCPACVAASASALSWLGLGAIIPVWRPLAFGFLGLGVIGFIRDFRKHRRIASLLLLIAGGILLYLGRYVFGGPEFTGWPIWGTGALLVLIGVVINRRHRVHVRGIGHSRLQPA